MRKQFLLFSAFVSLLLSRDVIAQTYSTNVVGHIEKGADVNFMEIAKYYQDHPTPLVRKPVFDEDGEEERPERPAVDPSLVKMLMTEAGKGSETPHTAYLPASPAPLDTFQAKVSDGTSIPPDTHGDVDSTYCVTAINTSITIQLRSTHAVVSSVTLDNFWTSQLSHGAGAFDPRVHYDPHYKRWIMVCDAYGQTTYSQIMVAVSATGNPTGTWHMYKLVVGSSSGTWLDYPDVGYNKRWIAVSGNFFSSAGSFTNDVVYVFDYASMMAGGTLSYGTLLPTGGSFTICPAITLDTAEANMFCMENYNGGAGQLELWKISGAIGAGLTLSVVGHPASTTHWQSSAPGGGADFAPQTGTTNKLQTNDDRIHSCKQRNGKLWCAYTAHMPATGTVTRASSMWWEIDTTAAPIQVGLIDDPTTTAGHNFYFFPSIAVNKNNDVLIGFAVANSNIHPSCGYALHLNADAAGTWRPIYTYRHGQMAYYQTFGGAQDRWGDYSATSVDPRNDLDFWTIQESVPTYSGGIGNSIWDTWWAYIQVCPTINAPTAGIAPTGPCTGTTALYTVTPSTGATSYTWTVTGTGWSGTSTTDSINLTVGTGVATVTVLANNSCTSSPAYTFTVTPTNLPTTPVITALSAACVGTPTATYSATSTGATSFSWGVTGTGWAGASSSSSLVANVGTGVATIICSATNSCGTTNDTLLVTPGIPPILDSGISLSSILCSGSTVTAYSLGITGATSYNWVIAGTGWGTSSVTTGDSLVITVGTGTGSITVNSVNGCGTGPADSATGLVPTMTPAASFTMTTHVTTTTGSVVVTYTGTAPGATTYTWNFGGGTGVPGVGAGPQTVTWTSTGTKTVTVTVDNGGCSSTYTDTVLVMPPVIVNNVNMPNATAEIMPNPSAGTFDIIFGNVISKQVAVKLMDMQGRVVYNQKLNGNSTNVVTVNAGMLPSGTYMANIVVDGNVIVKKVNIDK